MAAIDFPNSPVVGQIFTAPNGASYTWNGTAWLYSGGGTSSGSGGASLSVGVSPPVAPQAGALWWDSDAGILYVSYDDGTSQQWVQANTSVDPGNFYTKAQIDALFAKQAGRGVFMASGASISIPTNANTKLPATNEIMDVDGWYDAPSSRYNPKIPGIYEIRCDVQGLGVLTNYLLVPRLGFNGAVSYDVGATGLDPQYQIAGGAVLINMNGTTDYVEVFGYQTTVGAFDMQVTRFSGFLVRAL